ncbi:hypothetical protein ES703_116332 [subsurface metagenome]
MQFQCRYIDERYHDVFHFGLRKIKYAFHYLLLSRSQTAVYIPHIQVVFEIFFRRVGPELGGFHAKKLHKKSCHPCQAYHKGIKDYGHDLERINQIRGYLLSMVPIHGFWDYFAQNENNRGHDEYGYILILFSKVSNNQKCCNCIAQDHTDIGAKQYCGEKLFRSLEYSVYQSFPLGALFHKGLYARPVHRNHGNFCP